MTRGSTLTTTMTFLALVWVASPGCSRGGAEFSVGYAPYDKGFNDGHADGWDEGYADGWDDGDAVGYWDGYDDGLANLTYYGGPVGVPGFIDLLEERRWLAVDAQFIRDGEYLEGYHDGYGTAYVEAYPEGFTVGYGIAYSEGYAAGQAIWWGE